MLTRDQIHDIRRRYYEKGENISQIASCIFRTHTDTVFENIRTVISELSGHLVERLINCVPFNQKD